MNAQDLIQKIKQHPDFNKVGMILCHNGVVRGTSRDGRQVTGLKVSVDHEKLKTVLETHKKSPGIVEILIEIAEEKVLHIGDDVMFLVVAGDIRDHVLATLGDTLNAVKTTVTTKEEYFK
ncbi:MAG: molybdenum cofactor biosynthesis protein MoaE [Proteobacteria bacterium]|nr:molybdenum cofactor biosynthesis protein MoaE [Pseudomonadota bacterium]MBU4469504.1 molybdenum cofactor biosynthesis protein MoaE [Pseudomonadota bacterium]MCG2753386.1 molybdenum cofactor biosynthesis protein MoaE [Desulfobacteraceae bacterium]